MNYKSTNPPNWWLHSVASWSEIAEFFSGIDFALSQLLEQSNWSLIPAGKSHISYRFKLAEENYFIQIFSQKRTLLQPGQGNTTLYKTISMFTPIRPWLVQCHLESQHLKIDQWFIHEPATRLTVSNPKLLDSLSDFLSHLHGYNFTKKTLFKPLLDFNSSQNKQRPRTISQHTESELVLFRQAVKQQSLAEIDIEEYIDRYRLLAIENKPERQRRIESLYQLAKGLTKYFSADTFCHNDLGFNNILWSKEQKIKIIDWEYCGVSDRYIELANLISVCQMNQKQEAELLRLYSIKTNFIIDLEKLSQIKTLSSCINQLWQIAST
jgi:hypothetical protein